MLIPLPHPVISPPFHGALGWADEFVCIGLIVLVLVIAIFFVRGGEKDSADKTKPDDSDQSAEK
jgi:hypothetical protein